MEGNFIVRKSVGSTPAILGTKLKQNYYKVGKSRSARMLYVDHVLLGMVNLLNIGGSISIVIFN